MEPWSPISCSSTSGHAISRETNLDYFNALVLALLILHHVRRESRTCIEAEPHRTVPTMAEDLAEEVDGPSVREVAYLFSVMLVGDEGRMGITVKGVSHIVAVRPNSFHISRLLSSYLNEDDLRPPGT
jgi:hypothetical protein